MDIKKIKKIEKSINSNIASIRKSLRIMGSLNNQKNTALQEIRRGVELIRGGNLSAARILQNIQERAKFLGQAI